MCLLSCVEISWKSAKLEYGTINSASMMAWILIKSYLLLIVKSCLTCVAVLPAGHQTSSCESLHPTNTSATDSDSEQNSIPNHLVNRAKPQETNDSDLIAPFSGSSATTGQNDSSRNSSRNNSDFAIDPVNSIERVVLSSVMDSDALPFAGFVVAVHRKMVSELT